MVFYFTLNSNPTVTCYMGRDKHENEELIRWGWPEDWWFHVDSLSSAHVYVRLPYGSTMDELTDEMIEECCQLVKANSIEGSKKNDVRVVYTPWSNLKKTGDMDVGQVGYHDPKLQRFFTVARKNTALINRLEKTRIEKDPDFRALREERDARINKLERDKVIAAREAAQKQADEERKQAEMRSYASVMTAENLKPREVAVDDEDDDFM